MAIFIEKVIRPGVVHVIGALRGTPGSIQGEDGAEDVILTAEIIDGVFHLVQIPSDGGFVADIRDGVCYLVQPEAGSNYTAEITNSIFYLSLNLFTSCFGD